MILYYDTQDQSRFPCTFLRATPRVADVRIVDAVGQVSPNLDLILVAGGLSSFPGAKDQERRRYLGTRHRIEDGCHVGRSRRTSRLSRAVRVLSVELRRKAVPMSG